MESQSSANSEAMTTQTLFRVENYILTNVLKTFNRNEKSLKDDVTVLQNWIQSQPHLPQIFDSSVLKNFLILNKFSIEESKKKIDMYYTVKSKVEDVYSQINPDMPHMQEIRDILYLTVHPQLTKDMCRVFFVKLRNKELVHKVEPLNILRHALNIQEMRLREDVMYGDIFITDCTGVASVFLKCTPTIILKCFMIYEKVFSFRIKAVYLINFPPIAEKVLAFAKTVMKPKIFERIRISSISEIQKNFPADVLPPEYGGTGFSLQELKNLHDSKLTENKDLFDCLDNVRVDEKLRPEKLKNDDFLGFHGNFKKLDID